MITSPLIRPYRDCQGAAARGIARTSHLVVARESCQLHPRVDAELREDVAEMTVAGVRRDEEALRDFAIRQAVGHEARHGEL
jgi:hypothetical protein